MELFVMYTYTSEFDIRPFTAYGYAQEAGSAFIDKQIVAFYDDAIYYVDRDDYFKGIDGNIISGSEGINIDHFSITQDASGYFWLGLEKTGQIMLTQHDDTIQNTFSFNGYYPNIIANKTFYSDDNRLSCFYVSGSDIYLRSSQDGFNEALSVITGRNINKIFNIRRLAGEYTGYIGIFCEDAYNQPLVYLNNFHLYPPLWSYNTDLFVGFEGETTGTWDGLLTTRAYLKNVNQLFTGNFTVYFENYSNHEVGVITYVSGTNSFNRGEFING